MASSKFKFDSLDDLLRRLDHGSTECASLAQYGAGTKSGVRWQIASDALAEAVKKIEGAREAVTLAEAIDKIARDGAERAPEIGACILTDANMHTAEDCTLHDHEPGKKFYRTTIKYVALSEDTPPLTLSLGELVAECDNGECVGHVVSEEHEELTGKEAADALYAAGSQPEFFMLDDDGNAIED